MAKLFPQRRLSAVALVATSIAGLLMIDTHSNALAFVCGAVIGISLIVNIKMLIRSRRDCSYSSTH